LRVSLGTAFVAVVLLTCVLLGTLTYVSVRSFVREDLRRRLGDVATLSARQIDAGKHARVRSQADEAGADYRDIQAALRGVRDGIEGLRFVYTMRRGSDGRPVFAVDAEEMATQVSHVGEAYESPTPAMLAAFEPPYRARVEDAFFRDKWGTWLSGFAPVLRPDGSLEAIVGVGTSAAEVVAYERRLLATVAAGGAAVCALVLLVAVWVSRKVAGPMLALERDMARIQTFDLEGECAVPTRIREILAMRDALDNMRHGLRSFRRYVPADLVSELIRLRKEAVLEVERKEITIFFSDIEGFTTIAETMAPDELLRSLGVYMKGLTEAILRRRGTVDKFVGDGIMAFWGAPSPVADHAAQACLAALECQRFLKELAPSFLTKGVSLFPTRIGINTGEGLVGNVGYEERMNYTVMGDAVNVASRLEQLNKHYGTRILAGEQVIERARGAVEVRLLDRVAVKGKAKGITVYEVVAEKGALPPEQGDFLRLFGEGVTLHLGRRWEEALRVFEETLRRAPDDRPSRIFAERCRRFLQTPPPPEWDGVTVMEEK
jgi:adenylate cyclase